MQDAESIIELVGEIWSKAESQKCFQSLASASLGFHQALQFKQSSQLLKISRFSVLIIFVFCCSSSLGCIYKQHLFEEKNIDNILTQQKL